MVLRGKKQFMLLDPPNINNEAADVWVMKGTNEIFADYESYLRR
jgi:hypothetical protein